MILWLLKRFPSIKRGIIEIMVPGLELFMNSKSLLWISQMSVFFAFSRAHDWSAIHGQMYQSEVLQSCELDELVVPELNDSFLWPRIQGAKHNHGLEFLDRSIRCSSFAANYQQEEWIQDWCACCNQNHKRQKLRACCNECVREPNDAILERDCCWLISHRQTACNRTEPNVQSGNASHFLNESNSYSVW